MDRFIQDCSYAVRQVLRSPGFTAIAVITLALGIGANTALFSLLEAVLNRPLPGIRDASGLVWLSAVSSRAGRAVNMSFPDYRDYRDQSGVFSELATMSDAQFSLATAGEAERVRGQFVTGNFFSTLRVPFALGRGFTAEEDLPPGDQRVAVISYRTWEERFESDPGVIGRRIILNGQPFTIVGVAADRFNGVDHGELRALWVPMATRPRILGLAPGGLEERSSWWLKAVGRLRAGVSPRQADAAIATVANRIARTDSAGHQGITARTFPFTGGLTPGDGADITPVATLAAIVTGLVLLIACANVSNLLLARGVARRREIGVRLSIGASRARVVRQLLTESALLAMLATLLGFLLASWATDLLASVIPAPLDVSPSRRVLVFTIAGVVITTLLFGLVPALSTTRGDFTNALKDSSPGADPRRTRLQSTFIIAQVSLSLVLLVTAGLFLSSAYKANRMNLGFDASTNVLAVGFDLGLQGYTPEQATSFIDRLTAHAASLPGVESASFTNVVPMGERLIGGDVAIETGNQLDSTRFSESGGMEVYQSTIRPAYFATLHIPLLRGRDFNANDYEGSTPVVIVSQRFAERAWPGEDPIGKRVRAGGSMRSVVGVAREALTSGLRERARPIVYFAQRQLPRTMDLTLLVRARGNAAQLAASIRAGMHALDRNVPVFGVQTLSQYRSDRMAESRIGSTLLGIFGALSLSLAAVGIYAVMAFTVGHRRREIGVRIALGAVERQVVALFVRRGLRVTAVGTFIGLVLAAIMAKVLSTVFLGVSAADAIPFAAVTILLVLVAATASWLPARRASRIDPVTALRSE